MARSPIQANKQDNRKSSGAGAWRQHVRRGCTKFEKKGGGAVGNIEGFFIKKKGLEPLCQLWWYLPPTILPTSPFVLEKSELPLLFSKMLNTYLPPSSFKGGEGFNYDLTRISNCLVNTFSCPSVRQLHAQSSSKVWQSSLPCLQCFAT